MPSGRASFGTHLPASAASSRKAKPSAFSAAISPASGAGALTWRATIVSAALRARQSPVSTGFAEPTVGNSAWSTQAALAMWWKRPEVSVTEAPGSSPMNSVPESCQVLPTSCGSCGAMPRPPISVASATQASRIRCQIGAADWSA